MRAPSGEPTIGSGAGNGAGFVLIAAGVVLIGTWVAAQIDAFAYQSRGVAWLAREVARRAAAIGGDRAACGPHRFSPGLPIGRIEIPRLGISAMIADGCEPGTLRRAVGHVRRSALPGEAGNVCLAGHRDSFFRPLKEIAAGDSVRITTPDGRFDYRVDSIDVVAASRTDLLEATRSPTLTLITCFPFQFVGPAPERFVVRAGLRRPLPR